MEFKLDEFLMSRNEEQGSEEKSDPVEPGHKDERFDLLCEEIRHHIQKQQDEDPERWLDLQRKAILGFPKEVQYYLNEINLYLNKKGKQKVPFPSWYDKLDEAIFHENWGLAGIYEWLKHGISSSCKVIQPRIYFLKNGRTELQPQSISKDRFEKLKHALLLNDTSKRKNASYQEIYMVDGTRIEIYNNTKEPTIIFRRYMVDTYTFENLAALGSIDEEMIPMLKAMVGCGFNVNMVGPVRSGKTTFYTTYQTYEDPTLEGVQVENDPEVPWHILMPGAPITQMVVEEEEFDELVKPLMRSDADYLLMGEARTGRALRLMLMLTKKGTRRVKATYHTGNPEDFCYDIAQEIVNIYGGDVWAYMLQAAKGFHYLFEFGSLSTDKSKKKLKGIYEIRLEPKNLKVTTNIICHYNKEQDDWEFCYQIGPDKERIGTEEDEQAFERFKNELQRLAERKPYKGEPVVESPYSYLIPLNNSGGA